MSDDRKTPRGGAILAKQRKKRNDDSRYVFPKIPADLTREMILQHNVNNTYTSSYSIDYVKKVGQPAIPRPCSATRRNRPHPSKNFLNWRLPSELVPAMNITDDAAFTCFPTGESLQRFYEKFNGAFHTAQEPKSADKASSPIQTIQQRQRLLKREELENQKLPEPSPQTSPVSSPTQLPRPGHGAVCTRKASEKYWPSNLPDQDLIKELLDARDKRYLVKFLRTLSPDSLIGLKQWLQSKEEEDENGDLPRSPICMPKTRYFNPDDFEDSVQTPPSSPAKRDSPVTFECTLPLCLKRDVRPSFDKLYKNTNSHDRRIIGNLIEAGDRGYLEKFLDNMVRPEAITGIQSWLTSHDEKDREVALRFLHDIRRPSPKRANNKEGEPAAESPVQRSEKQVLKKLKSKKHGKNCSCAVCDNERSCKILKALSKQGTSAVIDEMRRALDFVPRPKNTSARNASVRKNQVAKPGGQNPLGSVNSYAPNGFVANKGALFMQPHRVLPSHFVIHPELP
ncbi:uncharacterized protein LOC116616241 [Nematostella vectensis]|uniref:uncharacterized protein LOC116616241 n=1 Tax=Nematostella vectensis TaxID=45351 RepID=UPI00138FD2A1|nr:uncharacterized protein LOC116616241 [Nematostella vectensis]